MKEAESDTEMEDEYKIQLTKEDLCFFKDSLKNQHEEQHRSKAVSIGRVKCMFSERREEWDCIRENINIVHDKRLRATSQGWDQLRTTLQSTVSNQE